MSATSIEWTDNVWNPVRGCSRVSPGCLNCYAEKIATRFSDPGQAFHLFAERTPKPHWTGKVELIESQLALPLTWRKPRKIFVNSMSDLFHESLSPILIDRVFAVMALTPHHQFQILTKRPEVMRRYINLDARVRIARQIELWHEQGLPGAPRGVSFPRYLDDGWPLKNCWLGVSVENQETADARIPLLLQTPAAVRFVSYEPALGPVDFDAIPITVAPGFFGSPLRWHHRGRCHQADMENVPYPVLDWIIVGGESGLGARPFDVQWARNTIQQCKAARVACFVKQLGANPGNQGALRAAGYTMPAYREFNSIALRDRKGSEMSEWPEDLRVRQFPMESR